MKRTEMMKLINKIRDALNTNETGAALIVVAHNAHIAEQELATLKRQIQNGELTCDDVFKRLSK